MLFTICRSEARKYLLEVKKYYADQLVSVLITYIIFGAFFLSLGKTADGSFYVGYIYWFLASSVIGEASVSISSEKQMGTFEQLMMKPVNIGVLMTIKTVVWLGVNFLKVLLLLLILKLTLPIEIAFHPGIIPVFLLSMTGVYGFTLILVALTIKYTKTASFESVISYVLLFFSGSLFSLNNMPDLVKTLASSLPLTSGIELSRRMIQHESVSSGEVAGLVLHSLLYLLSGLALFLIIMRHSRNQGINSRY
ncbi:hypothetical protein R70723_10430 [Paenibacillus sp. FSL R7-0273]|uniref:ABC transporter permease n=1 Tax=Paenibacillus sp. FSL R7-0273 TaxID=1536772 RepID=UPI0004F5E9F0|nr:ABC transporter permease [Paenibacillus sp. FSL R7-0273]AIQ46249.1 hypothetical protein R70723_10430 [Paenibacillus sp. FSL R7-0273]OMF89357.1 hypothetical protein BK144_19475 [Paenibacillus sp. FSL R7-0273]